MKQPRVTVFYEAGPQPQQAQYLAQYPDEIGKAIGAPLEAAGLVVRYETYTADSCTLTSAILDETDVLIHWAHRLKVLPAECVAAVHEHVRRSGMGLVLLHSAITGPVAQAVLGMPVAFIYRNCGERERVWTVDRAHPLAAGLEPYIELEGEEMYGEEFVVPVPDELVFMSWFEGGEVFRSGCVWKRGRGKVFFFRPGHETAPTFHAAGVKQVLVNAARWLAPADAPSVVLGPITAPPEGRFNPRVAEAAAAWNPLPTPKL